jgi:nucleoside-diphosphate-sugar epimerase
VIGDIRDAGFVKDTFDLYLPEFIFHTAAQRNPGYSETHINETITSNVFGTLNVVKACEESLSVIQCVFSSTGKASRYYTEEVYAGTKKMCEYILEAYAQESRIKYSMVRFTHILDNSLMDIQIKEEAVNNDFVGVHSPGKYVTAQNVTEAAHLMLNAIAYSNHRRCNFLLVRNLEWPVESLQMALYYIKELKRKIPIVFIGNPIGYTEKFFRGQLDWSHPDELNLLINVYESQFKRYTESEDIVIANLSPISKGLVCKALSEMVNISCDQALKQAMIKGLTDIIRDSLKRVDEKTTLKILKWGLKPEVLAADKAQVSDYGKTIPLLYESIQGSHFYKEVSNLQLHR